MKRRQPSERSRMFFTTQMVPFSRIHRRVLWKNSTGPLLHDGKARKGRGTDTFEYEYSQYTIFLRGWRKKQKSGGRSTFKSGFNNFSCKNIKWCYYSKTSLIKYLLQVQKCHIVRSGFLIIGKQVKDLYCLATVIGCVRWLSTVFMDGKEACRRKP